MLLMRRKLFPVLFTLILSYSSSYAQEIIALKGEIYYKNTNEPISFANISIKGKPVGTTSNELGQFQFYFPKKYLNDTLYISFLGYKTYNGRIDEILKNNKIKFYLDSINIPIEPIYVLYKEETAEQIVSKARKRIRKNYPNRRYYLEAFYRELSLRDDRYSRIVEASVSIQDLGYNKDLNTTRIKVNEIRKSDSYLEYDDSYEKIKKYYGERNNLLSTFFYDFIRARQNCSYINLICDQNIKRFKFTKTGITFNDNKIVHIISFRDTLFDSKITNRTADIGGILYIQSDDYAIIEFEYGVIAEKGKPNPYHFKGEHFLHISVKYKLFNGKYYPNIIRSIQPVHGAFKTNSTDSIPGRQFIQTTLMINNILTRRKDYSRIKSKEKELFKVDIYEKDFPYNPLFWKSYNIVLLNPNTKSVIDDLEKEKSLEEQFIKNSIRVKQKNE
jgi:hypothetical protein